MKTVSVKNKQIEQQNKIESSEIDLHKYSQPILLAREQRQLNEDKIVSSTNGSRTTEHLHEKKSILT